MKPAGDDEALREMIAALWARFSALVEDPGSMLDDPLPLEGLESLDAARAALQAGDVGWCRAHLAHVEVVASELTQRQAARAEERWRVGRGHAKGQLSTAEKKRRKRARWFAAVNRARGASVASRVRAVLALKGEWFELSADQQADKIRAGVRRFHRAKPPARK